MRCAAETYGIENRGAFVCATHLWQGEMPSCTVCLKIHLFFFVKRFQVATRGTFFGHLGDMNAMA